MKDCKVIEQISAGVGTSAYIGLGSNLDNPETQIALAVEGLKQLPDSRYILDSGLYLSHPMIPGKTADDGKSLGQPDYYNAVVLVETVLKPLELLGYLQDIENRQGRIRGLRWGPRTIDLDILLYGQEQVNESRLKVPHPGICEREFVLYPLQRLCADLLMPELEIPGHGKLGKVIRTCPENGIKFVGEIT